MNVRAADEKKPLPAKRLPCLQAAIAAGRYFFSTRSPGSDSM